MEKLSVIVPTYNEAHNIEAVLQTLQFADEIIVVDSFSTDDTVALAGPYATRILQRKFDYSASQKNWTIPQTKHEWILLLDADERLTPALEAEIKKIMQDPPKDIAGYWIYRKNHFMGKHIRFSGWQNDKVVRLFRKSLCRYEDKKVHEEIIASGRLGYLNNRLLHNTYIDLDKYIAKLNRYAYYQALDYDVITNRLNPFHFFIKPAWRFFKHYILQQGFRDGVPGFVISFLASYSIVMRYTKLWLYRRGQR